MSSYVKYTLKGGTRDGEVWELPNWQQSLYLPKRISTDDASKLAINGIIMWKTPEEIYRKNSRNEFVYQHTVHYKPREEGQIEI